MTLPRTTYSRDEAVKRALAQHTNVPDTCQLVTRTWVGAPSAGDYDGDGSADAEDGWRSEPETRKHPGDRKPPAGTPVSYLGGSNDNGHRALSLGPVGPDGRYMIRSTDAAGRGRVGTVPLDWPEREWGLTYVGWSETCDGSLIPGGNPRPEPLTPEQRAEVIKRAANAARRAGHPGWAARLRAWAKRIGRRA